MWQVGKRQLARFPLLEGVAKLRRTRVRPTHIVSPELCGKSGSCDVSLRVTTLRVRLDTISLGLMLF